jgi:hypothetical protein
MLCVQLTNLSIQLLPLLLLLTLLLLFRAVPAAALAE